MEVKISASGSKEFIAEQLKQMVELILVSAHAEFDNGMQSSLRDGDNYIDLRTGFFIR